MLSSIKNFVVETVGMATDVVEGTRSLTKTYKNWTGEIEHQFEVEFDTRQQEREERLAKRRARLNKK